MSTNIDIKYINKDFNNFKQSLIDYAKTYFPNTINDFSDESPAMMFIEMASYVGDVLAFSQDNQLQESLLLYAKEKENLISLAYMLGYRPKVTNASSVYLDIYQLVPALISGSSNVPDFSYAIILNNENIVKSSTTNQEFITTDLVDFSFSSSLDPTEVTVYSISNGQPVYYLLKKKVKAISGTVKSNNFTFGSPERFPTIELNSDNIIQILDITDSDGNTWYEVPFLAQETIFEEVRNIPFNNPTLSSDNSTVPYLLRLKSVPRRFTTRFTSENILKIEFGPGILTLPDEEIIPNSDNVGLGLIDSISKLNYAFDPSNFLYTKTYGISPSNTTLTVRYLVGGGVESNVSANDITIIPEPDVTIITNSTQTILDSIAVNNPKAATGGKGGDTIEDIRLNSLSSFNAQSRAVTFNDYIIRTLSLPEKYGSVAKVYITKDTQLSNDIDNIINNNPLALDLYLLSYNSSKQLTQASNALKNNLKVYLEQYRMLTDAVNIKNAYIINIGVKFDIITLPGYNNKEVLTNCINIIKDHFNIDKWQVNQPIIISELITKLDQTKGVQTVSKLEIENKVGENLGYSRYAYDIKSATKNNIVYPSLDPSIFEIKFLDKDILGRCVTL